ncbi:RNA-guided endonuclease InsQ/TnpB family protein [Clostridium sp. M14]|uniref:RNA-guided endonuclease InsQ/TnpB family protein n=1 Tax=Clostridium sp. M14 TaxID=2716311 RepID=UPI0013EE5831|nr:RNA-guided endonuclease TnpB family protein [Clostridium sp. M14]MBZ9693246.1 transposase [Clostridium sp. M14]
MKVNRVEKHNITRASPFWSSCDEMCFKSKNLYNYANYIMRQSFISDRKIYKVNELDKMINKSEPYKELGSQSAQRLLRLLDKNWKSFFVSVKDYTKNPSKYLGKPNLPKYKDKNGRYICELKNIQFRIENGYLVFSLTRLKSYSGLIKTNIKDKVLGIRVIPNGSIYVLEIVYEKEIQEPKEFNNRILGIDLGVNNLATCVNNVGIKPIIINGRPIKSINQYYNKKKAYLQSDLKKRHKKDWSNKLDRLQRKRDNKIDYYLHCVSKSIVNYCEGLDITQVVIGLNKTWKQESKLNNKINQNFISIPYDKLINMIKYKANEKGINVITNEESYTSGTSFLDNEEPIKENYNKSRRIKRGLFKSNNGKLINSDVNGAYNIIKKVIPNAFADGIEGVDLHPIRVNV